MDAPNQCLECSAPLTPAETQGLCARCLFKLGFASQLAGQSSLPASPGSSGPPPMMPFAFGNYRIERLLGKGGMGAVYEAEDLVSGRRVALKALGHSLDSPDTRKRFLREGRLAASINHPNAVYVYGTEEIEGAPVITMELIPGGTLQERVQTEGPMPVAAAVDAILQIIAGLEAAHAVGILHRDIKPSNCFIDLSGAVKVGDFGLSISTASRGDSVLTLAGSVLGTPEYSSPEQLRGEALDLRSDIYSVGMTLYYLLTGKTAFRAENLVQLLATVLDRPAPSPRTIRPDIPEALARVVMRCLAKQSGDRFKNYGELRAALLPFSSSAPTPATLGLRFVAGVIDHLLFTVIGVLLPMLIFGGFTAMIDAETMKSPDWTWVTFAVVTFQIAYFAVGEGRWGATLGKALVGLRVGDLHRNPPGIARALLRALIYSVPGTLAFFRLRYDPSSPEWIHWDVVLSMALWLYPALLCATARRRNGFATVTDLLTKTRVIQKSAYESRESVLQADDAIATTDALPQIGPFHVLASLGSDSAGELVLGYDTRLMRRVWIRKIVPGAEAVPAGVRNAARPGRLRWLQGYRNGEAAWDAYEAVPGASLTSLLHNRQPWKNVRHWLLDLIEELAAAARDGSMPAELSLDRVWITAGGGAKLLDFRAPGAVGGEERLSGNEANAFLNQIAISALEGRVASTEEARTAKARLPVALGARAFLEELRAAADLNALVSPLKALVQQRPAISRRRRFGLVAGCVIPSLVIGGFGLLGMTAFISWQRENPDVMLLQSALRLHERMKEGRYPRGVDPGIGLEPVETYIAGRFGRVVSDRRVWSSQFAVSAIPAKHRANAEQIVTKRSAPTAEEMSRARSVLGRAIQKYEDPEPGAGSKQRDPVFFWPIGLGGFFWAAFLSIAAALLFRGGVLMRALGIAVVTRNGSEASRGRMFWRAIVAWSPVVIGTVLVATLAPVLSPAAAIAVSATVILVLVIWSALRRERSLPDCLAGTWLVPR